MAFKIFRKVLEMLDVNAADITDGQVLAWDATNGEFIAADASAGGSGAPTNATYITQTHHASLSAEQALEDLATGIVKNTTTTGVLSIAAEGTDYYGPGGTDVALADGGTGASTAAGARTNLGLVIGTDVQAHDADLDTYAGISPSANIQSLLGAADYAAMRAQLDLEAGTDFPSLTTFNDHSARHENGGLDEISIAGLDGTPTELTNHLNDTTAAHAASAISYAGNTNLSSTDVESALDELDNEKQPLDSDLTAIAALTTNAAGRGLLTLADPNADRIVFWDDSAGSFTFLTPGTNLTITNTTIDASGSGGSSATGEEETITLAQELFQ